MKRGVRRSCFRPNENSKTEETMYNIRVRGKILIAIARNIVDKSSEFDVYLFWRVMEG